MSPAFRFVDPFAGVGGFHAALAEMGGQCVCAVEIDAEAAAVYQRNWGLDPLGDITDVANEESVQVPEHEVLAAGFPCQPFSKSGAQRGMDEARGTLFWNIARIVEERRPPVVILENVRNLAGPRHRHEWQVIWETLRDLGYRVSDQPAIVSPHRLPPEMAGRPQVRERVFITATRVDDGSDLSADPVVTARTLNSWDPQHWDLANDLPLDPDHEVVGCELSEAEYHWINAWDDFVRIIRRRRSGRRLPGFPIWVDSWVHTRDLDIPMNTPGWKSNFLRKNSEFYTAHKRSLDAWIRPRSASSGVIVVSVA